MHAKKLLEVMGVCVRHIRQHMLLSLLRICTTVRLVEGYRWLCM